MTTKKQELPQSVQVGASILFELRAQNVQLMDLRGVKDVTDYFLVATCESEAQMQAILNELRKEFKANKLPSVGVEYKEGVRWAVFDAGLDLMVHLFEEEKRSEISLDRLYADGKIETLDENDFVKKTTKKKSSEDELV
ncbi:MAG: ribosome silencing factor [Fibrobacter sp.]|jgi:ribosome-associated protein|uniref:ribosome silencing factor n=1 Tax=unclassified Fibrobacter TaxID=2634177 RepID=UPI00091F5773|nr:MULTISPECIES: ribosome silencing factor [unclassified Fibrobacter]MBQ3719554.1 ribosome silencing factor [Fibrobacter sp.]MBQ9225056.1 ribosome silencing factor [Fibrobacter sp.]MBR2057915.1 ribosome silencing factor [Fibrobacter sp.]MBR2307002.1 ribosome silencing factor [Fibrobacter sp.]SHG44755.1 ribosome-associated protein [Fibrobacter sp. UWCM]